MANITMDVDVIVKWDDGTENCVCVNELRTLKENEEFKIGTRVKMLYARKWFTGTVTATENGYEEDSSSDDEPLSNIQEEIRRKREKSIASEEHLPEEILEGEENSFEGADTDEDPDYAPEADAELKRKKSFSHGRVWAIFKSGNEGKRTEVEETKELSKEDDPGVTVSNIGKPASNVEYHEQTCEVQRCRQEVFSSCFRCTILLCFEHFEEDAQICTEHGKIRAITESVEKPPEEYFVEGAPREHIQIKTVRQNKRKVAKLLRNEGKEYLSAKNKLVAAKRMRPLCNTENCKKMGRKCYLFNNEVRHSLFNDFYGMGSLQLQREFISRFVQQCETKQRTTKKEKSRREKTNYYFFNLNGRREKVCRKLFLNTLDISEKSVRTCLTKIKNSGVLEPEKRGGRRGPDVDRDSHLRESIQSHINRFPKVDSHYCRKSSSRQYLHEDLSITKMYELYRKEQNPSSKIPSLALYRKIFRGLNLSFHRPKKDQCGLCKTYREGNEEVREKIEIKYKGHIQEKERIREIKEFCKREAKEDTRKFCGCFDLQQVIYLPISNDGAIFYKNRLSVFNLTIYNIADNNCYCFTWNETESKRGASEICTCLYKLLKKYDENGITSVKLFADGCSGQNRNSVVASTLLYIVNNSINIKDISLRFFAPYHGQNEGDSAHSAIAYAIKKSGEIFVPSQLHPIFRLSRRKQPYEVFPLKCSDFMNFKLLSENLRILTVRQDDAGDDLNWTEMVEFKTTQTEPTKVFFKTSHIQSEYRTLSLKRNVLTFLDMPITLLNKESIKLPEKKFKDLISLCSGEKPVIKLAEHIQFYRSLPH